jgi:hypothetical protein
LNHFSLLDLSLLSFPLPGPAAGDRHLFREIGLSDRDIDDKVNKAIRNFFYGDESLRCYYPVEGDEAYILDSGHDNVCSEGMSYGMMIAVQSGLQVEFDRLMNFAFRRMRRSEGDWAGLFAWQVHTDGTILDAPSAPDGEEYLAMALFFAWKRWGDARYKTAADDILHHMLHQDRYAEAERGVTSMFDRASWQVVFVPYGTAAHFTDPTTCPPFTSCGAAGRLMTGTSGKRRPLLRERSLRAPRIRTRASSPTTAPLRARPAIPRAAGMKPSARTPGAP